MTAGRGGERIRICNREGRWSFRYGNILCFEACQKGICLYTETEEVRFFDTIARLEQVLPSMFFRCHRSYLVNGEKIKRVIPKERLLVLEDGRAVPYSRSYRKEVQNWERSKWKKRDGN